MDSELEDRFDTIGQEAISAAEAIECAFADFVEGLEIILLAVNSRIEGAKSEQESREKEA